MPVSHPTLPVLSSLPSLELESTQTYPVEREVDRNALLDVAPDHESLLIRPSKKCERLSRCAFRLPKDIGCTMLRNAR
ncbi:hypothetical protein K443DRAFT_687000 [Laccaria amethystina LaAM-08-1]|uniref:Uncharacterized protein n=1 Tax=Laccaria amethystina LaAM-08-1 TaxID=1095629 RepID=A0A0C9WXE6_9AGAR|nr:hypothetical protein K443DRAFT_687000 [Laccaria amethystina LaAM-08-1]